MTGTVKQFTWITGRAVETCEQKRSAPMHLGGFTQRNGVSLMGVDYTRVYRCVKPTAVKNSQFSHTAHAVG